MKMVRVEGREDLDTFVKNKWGILEPPYEREDVYSAGFFNFFSFFFFFSSFLFFFFFFFSLSFFFFFLFSWSSFFLNI